MRMFWRTFYWSAFVYSFLIMPFVMQYEISGEFEDKERINFALWRVARTYSMYAVGGGVFLFYLWMRGTFDGSKGAFTIKGFLIAMGSAAGLLQIIVFLGYGLVSVPKHIHCMASFKQRFDLALCYVDQCEDKV